MGPFWRASVPSHASAQGSSPAWCRIGRGWLVEQVGQSVWPPGTREPSDGPILDPVRSTMERYGMARLIYVTNMSLDGYIEDESGAFDWFPPSDEYFAFTTDLLRSVGT